MNREYYTVMRNNVLASYHRLDITNEEMMLLIQFLSFQQEGEEFPAISKIGRRMNLTDQQLYQLIQSLIDRGFLSISSYKNEADKLVEYYSLTPLYQKLDQLDELEQTNRFQEAQATKEGEVFEMIQKEFGRQLSPIEYQQIGDWFSKDHYDPETVKEAVKEAVLNQAYSLKYMDRILINWSKRKQTKATSTGGKKSNTNKNAKQATDLPPVPLTKWLNK